MPPGGGTLATGLQRDGRSELARQGNATRIVEDRRQQFRDICGKCGARRVDRQIGLEATPDEYLATMVEVFREVRRVLRPDGTLWLNIGDSYAANGISGLNDGFNDRHGAFGHGGGVTPADAGRNKSAKRVPSGLKPKDLLMMPARLALALQQDGWWIRSDIIWHKPNPMPESVNDRPTSAYEHVFLLTKSARYFWDAEAVREEAEYGRREWSNEAGNGRRRFEIGREGRFAEAPSATVSGSNPSSGRNLRNVWTIATHAYPAAHFATYPPELAERCIRAGTSERGCCAACGAPWRRETQRGDLVPQHPTKYDKRAYGVVVDAPDANDAGRNRARDGHRANMAYETTTTGWAASCACAADVVPATVLDPFAGAGTTLLVADRLQRGAIGIELNASYTTMAMDRVRADAPLFVATPEPQPVPGFAQPDLFAEAAD